jgi:hypothetical protein
MLYSTTSRMDYMVSNLHLKKRYRKLSMRDIATPLTGEYAKLAVVLYSPLN